MTKAGEDIEACLHCGRCVLAGPPCCDAMARDYEFYAVHGMSLSEWKRRRSKKRDRRLARRKAKRDAGKQNATHAHRVLDWMYVRGGYYRKVALVIVLGALVLQLGALVLHRNTNASG